MTIPDISERQLRGLLAEAAPTRPPSGLFDAVMAGVATSPQRRSWQVRSTSRLAGTRTLFPARFLERGPRLAFVVPGLVLTAIVAALLFSGGGSGPVPPSLGSPSPSPSDRSPEPARTSSRTPIPVLPGESWILYERFTFLGGGLYLMRPDGTDSHRIMTAVPGVLKDADWSPDGDSVVFIDEQTEYMWIAGIDGSNAHRVGYCDQHRGCEHPAWSPDGTRIVFSLVENGTGIVGPAAVSIHVLDIAANTVTDVVRLARPLLADVPRWSPDGTQVVIGVDQMNDAAFDTGAAIAVVPAAGGAPRYLTPFDQFAYTPDWNRTDGTILFSVQIREAMESPVPNDTWNIFTLQPDGTGLRQVTDVATGTHLWFATWTPDGTHILAADQGRRLAVLVDPQTGTVTSIGGADLARPLLRPLP